MSFSRFRGGSVRVMTPVAVLSVAISVAVIIISLSVLKGFKGQIEQRITSLMGDITVTPSSLMIYRMQRDADGNHTGLDTTMRDRLLQLDGVRFVSYDESVMGVVNTSSGAQGLMLRGVDDSELDMIGDLITDFDEIVSSSYSDQDYSETVNDSSLLRNYNIARRRIILSDVFARQSGLSKGDMMEVVVMDQGLSRKVKFKVQGIYDSGVVELDKQLAFVRYDDVSLLHGDDTPVSSNIYGLRVYLDPYVSAQQRDEIANLISEQEMVQAMTIRDNYAQIFDWLSMLDMNTVLIMVIMLVVAAVNMICAVLVLLLESRRMIGLLRSVGMSIMQIQRMFVIRSCSITIIGMIIGSLIAFIVIFVQSSYGLITLDSKVYMLSVVPMDVVWWEFILVEFVAFVVLTMFMIIPTLVVSRISPDHSLKIS